jgi:hypothetical protein
MKKQSVFLFVIFIFASVLVGTGMARFSKAKPEQESKAQSTDRIPQQISKCYPSDRRPPTQLHQVNRGQTTYFFGVAELASEQGNAGNGFLLFMSKPPLKCQEFLRGGLFNKLSAHVPLDVALDLKEQYWQSHLDQYGRDDLLELLNTPFDGPHPLFFLNEDVAALSRLGYKPGPKATIADSEREAIEKNPQYKFLNELDDQDAEKN